MPTKIEWAKEVWNPIAWTGETVFVERALAKPLRWEKPRRIFLCSMSDLWHRSVKREWVYQIMAVVALCQGRHTIIVTTKRAKRMKSFFDQLAGSSFSFIQTSLSVHDTSVGLVTVPNRCVVFVLLPR